MSRRIFVDNLNFGTTQETLEELFKTTGKVESVEFPPQSKSKNSLVHAFVVMSSEMEASSAIFALNNTELNGSKLTVTQAGPVTTLRSGFSGARTISERKNRR